MSNKILCVLKTVGLFALWALAVNFVPDIPTDSPAVMRLWHEAMPFLILTALTALFILAFDRKRIKINILSGSAYRLIACFFAGTIWIAIPLFVLWRLDIIRFFGRNYIDATAVCIIALLVNTLTQELFVRGYIYRLFRRDFNPLAALAVTTVIFTALHYGVFKSGIIAVLSVFTMNIFLTLIMELMDSLAASAVTYFMWNLIGGAGAGIILLPEAYPNLINCEFIGLGILAGNAAVIESNIITLAVNILGSIILCLLLKRKWT